MANAGEQTGGLREGGGRFSIIRILTAAGVVAVVALLLGWWILASHANTAQSSYDLAAASAGDNVRLELLYPETLLIDQQHELTVRFTAPETLAAPLTVTLTFPPGIRATDTQTNTLDADTTICFDANENGGQRRIPITNAGTQPGWRTAKQTITVSSSLRHEFEPAPAVTIEGAEWEPSSTCGSACVSLPCC